MEEMEPLPQPPPDVPAPPPGEEALRSRRWMKAICWVGGLSTALVLLVFLMPLTMMRRPNGATDRAEARNRAEQIGLALMEFDAEYGSFPNAVTGARVKADTSTPLTLGSASSNELFRQLLATGGFLRSEKVFYAKGGGIRRPDNVFHSDRTALAPGECGFAYIAGLSSESSSDAPVLLAPMIRGTTTFDRKVFGGKAVVLRVDNSVTSLPIDKSGRVMLDGMDLFDPRQPFWGGKAPDLKWQE